MSDTNQNSFVTLGGECFKLEFQSTELPVGRIGVSYLYYVTDLGLKRGRRLVFLVAPSDTPGAETVCLNSIRGALDSGIFSFDDPHSTTEFRELPYKRRMIGAPSPSASDVEVRQLIINEAYWLSWKFGGRQPIQFDSPADLDYLSVEATVVRQNQWLLEERGLLERSKIPGMGRPTAKLVEFFESREKIERPNEWVFPPKTPFDAYKTIKGVFHGAERQLFIVDNYIDDSLLDMVAAISAKPQIRILTYRPSADLRIALRRFVDQYGGSYEVRLHSKEIHDRAIVVDEKTFYALGASIKDLGKNLSLMNKLEDPAAIETLRAALAEIWVSAPVL